MYGYSLSVYSILAQYLYETCISYIYTPLRCFFPSSLFFISDPVDIPVPEIVLSPTEQYIQRQTSRLLNTFDQTGINYNENVDAVFYSKKELNELLKDEKNTLEPKWRTKILFETTPRGNIVMHYDAFKQGFAYYSDQTGISYSILNAVAMKYVITFRCRDFFMDESVLPEHPSGITLKYAEDDLCEKEKKRSSTTSSSSNEKDNGIVSKNAFVKFKSYNSVSSKANGYTPKSSEKVSAKSIDEQTAAPKQSNKHISLGKIANFSFIQKQIPKTIKFESALLPKQLSYSEYKRLSNEAILNLP